MTDSLTRSELQGLRLHNQRLRTRDHAAPEMLVTALGTVQAQEKASALLAIRARMTGVTEAGLREVLEQERRLLRTWCLRGTLHLVTDRDVQWLLPLVAPRLLRNSRRRYRELGLDERTLARATELIIEALTALGPLTRTELGARLEAHSVSADGQRLPHLLRRAALLRLLCLGPERDGEETYVLFEEWVGRYPTVETGWKELAERYLATYGPASVADFVRWSGALVGDARAAFAALQKVSTPVTAQGRSLWLLTEQADQMLGNSVARAASTHLLPAYDPLLLGYESRDWLVKPAFARTIHPGGGFLRPTLLAGGEAAGTWKTVRRGDGIEILVNPFRALDSEQTSSLQEEVADLGRFYGMEAVLSIADKG